MSERLIKADLKAVEELGANLGKAKRAMLGRATERGRTLLREEVPEDTGNLKREGVQAPDYDFENLRSEIVVSATRGAATLTGVVIGGDGKIKKSITLRPQPNYNYAEVVARGNKDAVLHPKNAKAFLIPVTSTKAGEEYVLIGGKKYVFRTSRKGQKPNPFDERAASRLEQELPAIGEKVLEEFVP